MMIDIGVNLTSGRFHTDLSSVMERARQAGIQIQVVTGTSVQTSEEALALAHAHPKELYATSGVHPHVASSWNEDSAAAIRQIARDAAVVAIGECGLDFNRNFSPRQAQVTCFEAQLELAAQVRKPLFLHQRDAHDTFMPILTERRNQLTAAVVHCFTGTRAELEDYLAEDCHIGVTGWICDKRRGHQLRELVKHIPSNRLMVETDAPYLTPHNLPRKPKGNRNEPAFLPYVIETLAQCRGESAEEVASLTAANARTFFQLE